MSRVSQLLWAFLWSRCEESDYVKLAEALPPGYVATSKDLDLIEHQIDEVWSQDNQKRDYRNVALLLKIARDSEDRPFTATTRKLYTSLNV